ncbi:hypothetical protein [uncultured Desulfuromonas sp.]|uniref:hypothetical protein n=1 Tax=uncultured Desulfuromonas sp. TaxID=181013 RepID=UPI002AAB4823|nr:hypothetical protein [uncultured Desulfuromonas sp.]
MFLMLSVGALFDDFWKVPYKTQLHKDIAKMAGCSPRRVSDCLSKKRFSYASERKIRDFLKDQDVDLFDNFSSPPEAAISWMVFSQRVKKENSSLPFLPKTLGLIENLASRDLAFQKLLEGNSCESRLSFYKQYLIDEVVPFYCDDLEGSIAQIEKVETIDQIRKLLPGLLFEGVLHLLSYAESEYLFSHCLDHRSVLVRTLPNDGNSEISPSMRFFKLWTKSLGLNSRKDILEAMFIDFYEDGISDEDESEQDFISSDALEKQIQRYFNEGKRASFETIGKLAKGLYATAAEVQKRDEDLEDYMTSMKDVYAGVLVLDRLLEEGKKYFREYDLFELMGTYQSRFDKHMEFMKKEVVF